MLNSLNNFNGLYKDDFLPYVDYSNKKEHRITNSQGKIFTNPILNTKNDSDNDNNNDNDKINKLYNEDIVESDK